MRAPLIHIVLLTRFPALGWLVLCMGLCGCEPESLTFTEVKRVHEVITPSEWASFVRIVDHLPDRQVPSFPAVFPPAPQWEHSRSARICDLYQEEMVNREACWDTARICRSFERHKALVRELRKEKLTPEQFAGLLLTVGAALCRNEVPDDVDLAALSERSRLFRNQLAGDETPFSTLSRETRHAVLQEALWIPRSIRADKLKQVPPENRALAKKHYEWLIQALPGEFLHNPVDEIRDLLEENGLPFEELPESESDEDLQWQHAGTATPRN